MFFCVVEEPITAKKRKGKDSRPLRIDLILQPDSLVPPPKESVFLTTYLDVYIFIYFLALEKYMDFSPSSANLCLIEKCKILYVLYLILFDCVMFQNDDP